MVVRMTASAGSPAARKKRKATQMEYGCLGKNVIMPASPFKITWDILCVGLLLYAVVITPLKIGFGIEEHCPDGSWVFDVIVDAIFLFDCGLNFFTAAWIKDHFGELKVSGRMDVIAKTYLKSWFIVDFSSSVPVDAVMSLVLQGCGDRAALPSDASQVANAHVGSLLKMVRLLRMVKLLKLLRILKLKQRFNELTDNFPFLANLRAVQLLNVAVTIVYVAHLIGCVFYWVGASTYYENGPDGRELSWLAEADIPLKETQGLTWTELGPPYVASLYWTITTITTVGYGDVTPTAPSERIFAMFCMIFGTGVFGYIIGSATVILTASKGSDEMIIVRMNTLQQFMEEKKLPSQLQVKLRRHFRYYWQNAFAVNVEEQELLRLMSAPLRQEALRFVYKATVGQLPLFMEHPSAEFHDQLLRALQPLYAHPGEVLIQQGGTDTACYLMIKGSLEVWYTPKGAKEAAAKRRSTLRETSTDDNPSSSSAEKEKKESSTEAAAAAPAVEPPQSHPTSRIQSIADFLKSSERKASEWPPPAGAPALAPSGSSAAIGKVDTEAELVAVLEPGALVGEILPLHDEVFSEGTDGAPSDAGSGVMAQPPSSASPQKPRNHIQPRTRTATIIATDHCELFTVDGLALAEIVANFGDVRETLVRTAKARLEMLRERDVHDEQTTGGDGAVFKVQSFASKMKKKSFSLQSRKSSGDQVVEAAPASETSRRLRTQGTMSALFASAAQQDREESERRKKMPKNIGGNLVLLNAMLAADKKKETMYDHGAPVIGGYDPMQMHGGGGAAHHHHHHHAADGGGASPEAVSRAVASAVRAALDGPLTSVAHELSALRTEVNALKKGEEKV